VLVLSRPALIDVMHTVTVVAITSTGRGSPTEVPLGVDEGLKPPSFANLTNLFTVPKAALRRFVGTAGPERMRAVCRALAIAVGCD
jgi:mRNA-degrading endonuclease toxin of MazEF toxin-antitoxin module